jgi:hypothetical protein
VNLFVPILLLLQSTPGVVPLTNAHAHNDYEHSRPLFDALSHGFCSVEADIFVTPEKALLVGHNKADLKPERTLQKLYLDPLRQRIKQQGGSVFKDNNGKPVPFTLLIDIKTDAASTYPVLHEILSQYADIFTEVRDGKVTERAITAILSGSRPSLNDLAQQSPRYAGYDGRLSDLNSDVPAHLMPWISDNWALKFGWNGATTMPTKDREKLDKVVQQAHSKGRKLRFWATPEKEAFWQMQLDSRIDVINTDRLNELKLFLLPRIK